MKKHSLISVAMAASLLSGALHAEQHGHNAPTPVYRATQVTEQITMLQGSGGNIALLTGDQGLLLVDDDYKASSPALLNVLEQNGGVQRLTYVINTHWHGDHTEGNLALGEHALIVAHDSVRERLLTQQEIRLFNMVSEPYPKEALPEITYSARLSLHINDEAVDVVHYAGGHTDGDSVVFFRNANVVHMGDHFFNGFYPFVDVEHGGNVLRMAENIAAILPLLDENTRIIPGHGPLATKADLEAFHAMLLGTTEEVRAMKAEGMNLGQIQLKGLSSRWDAWAGGFLPTRVWIGIVYASL